VVSGARGAIATVAGRRWSTHALVRDVAGVVLAGSVLLAMHGVAAAQPTIARPVTDEAGVLSSEAVEAIEARLHAHRDAGRAQIALLVVRTTYGTPITDYALRAAETWGGGTRARDDGVLFVLAIADREMRIEVGYGLEQTITDSVAMRILDTLVEPMRAGRFDAAAWMVADALIARTGGESAQVPAPIAARTSALPAEGRVERTYSGDGVVEQDAAYYERLEREDEARSWSFLLGAVVFFVLPVLFVFLFLWRSSNVDYDSDGIQRIPWSRLPVDVLGALAAMAAEGASGGGGSSGRSGGGFRHGGGGGSSRSYGGGGGRFGGGGASKRW
jgi:uncharacterized protein